MLTSSPTLGWWIQNYGSIQDSRDFGGVVPAYPIFMFIGIIVVIICTIIKMRMKKIPLNELYWAILIIVPVGIFGGSIFGKAFLQNGYLTGSTWYKVFFFWDPGMSLFGAVGLGTVGGFVWFYKRSKVTQISVWVYADCILPNVLLGQAIGRWGNMYNHEIMGNVVSYDSLQWLIPGIRDKLFYWDSTTLSGLGKLPSGLPLGYVVADIYKNGVITGHEQVAVYFPNGGDWASVVHDNLLKNPDLLNDQSGLADAISHWLHVKTGDVVDGDSYNYVLSSDDCKVIAADLCANLKFREPLFLYESLANTALWLILTFVVPNLSRWIQGKGKYPWDIQPNAYPGWYNPNVKSLPLEAIESWKVQRPIKYKESKDGQYTISLWEAWNKAYYLYEPSEKILDKLVQKQDKRMEHESVVLENLDSLKEKHKSDLFRLDEVFKRKTNVLTKKDTRYKKLHDELIMDVKANNLEYKSNRKDMVTELGGWKRYFSPNPDARYLEELNNPNKYFIVRSGVLSGAYILGYMIIRIILETHRIQQELFVQNNPIPDYIVLGLLLASGLFIILWTTFVSPYYYREVGWLYEKSY